MDGVYFERDGFYNDVNNDTTVNNRDRYLVRGQLLFEPSDTLNFRLVADYSKKDEACCAATFVQPEFARSRGSARGSIPSPAPRADRR